MDLMLLNPYFQGITMRMGAPFWLGSLSPYMPKHSSARGCIASSMRNPSTYGSGMPAYLPKGICLESHRVSNATYLAFAVGSTCLMSALSENPTHGTTIDHASTQRWR